MAHVGTTITYASGRVASECSCGILFTGGEAVERQAAHAAGLLPEVDDLAALLSRVVQMREGE